LAIAASGQGDTIFVCPGTYRERVAVIDRSAMVIMAAGTATIDGSDDFSGAAWTQYGTTAAYSTPVTFAGDKTYQLFIDDVRYTYVLPPVPPLTYGNLAPGTYTYDTDPAHLGVYVSGIGGGNPASPHSTFISTR